MALWRSGSLSGFDGTPVEICGRIVKRIHSTWLFHDGIGLRTLPREHIRSYRSLGDGYCAVTIPAWLAKQRRFRMKRLGMSVKPAVKRVLRGASVRS